MDLICCSECKIKHCFIFRGAGIKGVSSVFWVKEPQEIVI